MRTKSILFTSTEDDFLRTNRSAMSDRELASRLGRSIRAVESRSRKLSLRHYPMRPFTPTEDETIRAGFGGSSVAIARELERDPAVIRSRAKRLGLGKWKRSFKDFAGYKVAKIERRNGAYARIPEHRYIIEQVLGRHLESAERVHHINGRKRDNRIDNLFLCASDAIHSKAHHSVVKLLAPLLERGLIFFNRTKGVYEVCETSK